MAASDHESDDGDSGVNVGSFGVRDMSGIDRLYDHERKSRLGNVQGLLAMSAAGAISSILVIVPDSKWSKWVPEFREEGDKYPFHEVYIHAKTFAYHTTKLSNKEDYQRLNVYQKSRITLTSYSLLAKEYEIVWNHKGNDSRKSDFFRKIWGLTVLQNCQQIPDSSDIAKAAAMIHPSRGGRRYVVWDDDHWDGKTKKIAKASESKGGTKQKRKRVTNIKDGIISKKKQSSIGRRQQEMMKPIKQTTLMRKTIIMMMTKKLQVPSKNSLEKSLSPRRQRQNFDAVDMENHESTAGETNVTRYTKLERARLKGSNTEFWVGRSSLQKTLQVDDCFREWRRSAYQCFPL